MTADYPLHLTTGRPIYHFHTRTKNARTPELQAAAPRMWAELHPDDAAAAWSQNNPRRLSEIAADHGMQLDGEADGPGRLRHLPETMATLIGRRPEPGLMLLEQLREIYLLASSASLAWEQLAQHAQAKHETDILELTKECHLTSL